MKSILLTLFAGGLGASVPFLGLPETPSLTIIAGEPHGKTAALYSVIDSDTLTVSMDGRKLTVRLDGIDAPEPGQQGGPDATSALTALVKNRPLKIVFTGRDPDGVALARIHARGIDIAERLLRDGWAWYREDRDKAIDSALLADAEAEAQLHRRGLWAERIPVRPWEWRQRREGPKVVTRSVTRSGSFQ
ncbi:MAG TPA: thermonuclease family protein [Verrucomicrobiales bacterium]|nr:thermonuclease family protein [Verrucomicrobiales bacterium]